jgi:hypothetical protein
MEECGKLSSIDAQLVLVLAAQHAHQKAIVWKFTAHVFQGAQIGLADSITGILQQRINLRRTPIIKAIGKLNSRQDGSTDS